MPWNIVETPKQVKFYPVENQDGTEFRRVGGLMIRGMIRHDKSPADSVWRVVYTNRAGKGSFSITAPDRTVMRLEHKLDGTLVKKPSRAFNGANRKGGMSPTAFQKELAELCGGEFAGNFYGEMVNAVKEALCGE